MFDLISMNLAVAMPDLTILYWICMIVGGSLLVFSMLGAAHGHTDVDFHPDVSADVDIDIHADVEHGDAASLATWLSVRFMVYFVAVFGVLGVVFTYLTDVSGPGTLGVAVLGGAVVGQGVHQLFRKLRRSSSDSATTVKDYLDKIGRVSIAITHPRMGEIAVQVRSYERYIPATAKHPDTTFKVGEEVAVVGYHAGVAEVVSREEFEFLTNKD